MNTLNDIVGHILCLAIAFAVQAAFVLLAAKFVRASCTFKEASTIAGICAVLLMVPKIGWLLSPIAFFFLFRRMLAADGLQMIYAFLAFIFLNVILMVAAP